MNRTTCPYLGLKDDPTTALNFPSEGNFCHHALPAAPVKGTHQQQFCLTADHPQCPLFQAAQAQPMPPDMIAPSYSRSRTRRIITMLGIPALLACTTALGFYVNSHGFPLGSTIPVSGANMAGAGEWSLLNTGPTNSPFPPTPSSSALLPANNCPMPQDWVPYTVNPTDSLYRLSVIYGVSVEQLQQANCMGAKATILPGEVIYVPFLPTDTPVPTATPTTVYPTNPQASSGQPGPASAAAAGGQGSPGSTPVPPAAAPPQPGKPGQNGGNGFGNGFGHGNGNGGGHGNGNGNGKGKKK